MPLMMWLAVAVWTIVILLPLWPQIKREWCEGRRCRVWVYECGACRGSGLAWDDDEFDTPTGQSVRKRTKGYWSD